MRVLLIGLNYLPESTSIGPYTADLAEYLVKCGHQVQVVTGFPMAPQWRVWDGYRNRWFMRETINLVLVLRTFLYVPARPKKALNRILFDMSFAISSFLAGLTIGRVDIIVIVSPPLQLGLTGWVLGILKRAPFFFHIQDLVPDAAVATGMLMEKSLALRLAMAMERFIYHRAKGIGVISEGFVLNLVNKGVPPEKIELLPNYVNLEFLVLHERNNNFRRNHNIAPDDFLVMYSGSIALKQGLHTFIKAAVEFKQDDAARFFIVGEGPYRHDLEMISKQLNTTNMHFLSLQPRENLPEQLSAADVLVITQRRAVTDIVFPGKLLYYMAAARPILASVNPESLTGQFIAKHELGLVVSPEDPVALGDGLRFLMNNREEARRLGDNGRNVVEKCFDRQVVLKQFTIHLESLANSKD